MDSIKLDELKQLCKDEQSFEELKRIVQHLKEERDQYHSHLQLLEGAIRDDYDSILITELELEKPGPKIVYVNDGFCEMTGYSKEEVIGKTPRILQGPKTDRAVLDKLKKRLKEGQSFFGQTVNYRKDGTEFVNQWDIHPLTDSEGNITHWVSYQHDITERKRAEKMLVDTKIDFDGLREESKRTVLDVDVQGNIVMANKSFRELTGYGKNELRQTKAWDLFPKKYRDSLKNRFDQADEKQFFDDREFKGIIKHKSGMPIQIQGNTKLLNLKDQTLIRCEVKNISLQKRIMETLSQRNQDFTRIVDKASEFTYQVRFEGNEVKLQSVSEEFPEISGLSQEAVLGKNSFDKFIHNDDLTKLEEHFQAVKKGKRSTCEYRLQTSDGKYVEVIDYCRPEKSKEDEQIEGALGAVSVDLAYRKAEEA